MQKSGLSADYSDTTKGVNYYFFLCLQMVLISGMAKEKYMELIRSLLYYLYNLNVTNTNKVIHVNTINVSVHNLVVIGISKTTEHSYIQNAYISLRYHEYLVMLSKHIFLYISYFTI